MSDRPISSSLTNLLSELATFGSRHDDSSTGAIFPNQFDDIDGPNTNTMFISQMEQPAQYATGHRKASYSELTGLLSANAEDAQYAARKFQNGINEYRAAQEPGEKDAFGRVGGARSRTSGAFATPLPDVQRPRDPTLVNHNGATFGTVGTGGIVKKPTTSTRPRPRPAALPSRNPAWGVVGEEGDMKPSTTTAKPKAGRRSAIHDLRNGIGVLR